MRTTRRRTPKGEFGRRRAPERGDPHQAGSVVDRPESAGRVGSDAAGAGDALVSRQAFLLLLGTPLVLAAWPSIPDPRVVTRSSAAFAASSFAGGALQIVAHEDDDLLFQSPDLLHDVQAGRRVRTVFVTTGDAAKGRGYWSSRERGSLAAYAQMAGVADAWTVSDAGVSAAPLRMLTLTGAPQISLVFMRLPDGNRRGTGMARYGNESLMKLWNGSIASIRAVDGSARYTASALRNTFTELMTTDGPTTVRTLDWTIPFGTGDNADHTATALFARQAHRGSRAGQTLFAYQGYPVWVRLPNVSGPDLAAKRRTFRTYATHDRLVCLEPWCAGDVVASVRLARQYVTATESVGG